MTETGSYKLCPACGAEVPLLRGKRQTTCPYCGTEQILAPSLPLSERPTAQAPQPEEIKVGRDEAGQVQFSYRWFNPYVFIAIVGAAGFIGFLMTRLSGSSRPEPVSLLIMTLAMLCAVIMGIMVARMSVTTFTLSKQRLKVKTEPIPWPAEITLEVAQIRQFYCRKKFPTVQNGRRTSSPTFDLVAIMKDGSETPLLKQLLKPDVPVYLEQKLEHLLRIENERIPKSVRYVE